MKWTVVCVGIVFWFVIVLAPMWAQQADKAKTPQHGVSDTDGADAKDIGGPILPPGEDPQTLLVLPFAKHVVKDQETFWTSPPRLRMQDLRWTIPAAAFTGTLVASD